MKLDLFEIETWMTIHEKEYTYNLGESTVAPLSMEELLCLDNNKEQHLEKILNAKLDYGPIVGSDELREGILKRYQTGTIDNITITHGCVSANELVLETLLEAGDHIITIFPTYQQLYSLPQSFGVEVDFVDLKFENDWIPSIGEFEILIKENTKMIAITSPNNPTGMSFPNELLLELVTLCKKYNLYLFADEAYRGAGNEYEVSVCDLYDNGISTSSMSKTMGLAGLRIGWVKSNIDIITLINERRDYSIISSGFINDYLAMVAFDNYDKIHKRSMDIINKNKTILKLWIENQKLIDCNISSTGTIAFLHYKLPIKSKEFCIKLQKETGVFLVPGACFQQEYFLRFGLANTTKEIENGLEVFGKWLNDQYK